MTNNASHAPRVGSLVAGRYRIESVIGTGGMAVVYRAMDEDLGRAVALKVFREGIVDAAAVKRQAEEIRLIAGLDHPALVTLYDAVPAVDGDTHASGVLVMQLVEGHDLRHRIAEKGPLSPETVAAIAADVAGALAYVHGQGVIHRDVAPANVLLPEQHEPGAPAARLADFGIARLIDSAGLTATGSIIGTATYLSPEQAEGKPLGPSTDIYSLGLTLLEALTGERAFPGTAVESATARLYSDPAIPDRLGAGWATLIGAMTSRDPAARPTAAAVVTAASDVGLGTTLTLPMATAVLPAGTGPTQLMPTANDGATEVLGAATAAVPPAARPPRDPSKRRAAVVIAALAAAAIAAVILANVVRLTSPTAEPPAQSSTPSASPSATPTQEPPPAYPPVAGDLGESLAGLQGAVDDPAIDDALADQLQQAVLEVTTSAAAAQFETARDQLEQLRRLVDDSREDGSLDEQTARSIREAIDEVHKDLEDAIHDAEDDDKPGKGPKND